MAATRKTWIIVILFVLLLSIPFLPARADDAVYENLKYRILDDGTVEITGPLQKGGLKSVVIPESIENKPVTSIADKAFYSCEQLKAVSFPSSLENIGDSAFFNCRSLMSVSLQRTHVKHIGDKAFSGCVKINSLQFNKEIISIGSQAFYKCTTLGGVDLPPSLTSIGKEAFSDGFVRFTVAYNSIAEEYCRSNGLKYELSGMTVTQTNSQLSAEKSEDYDYRYLGDNMAEITKYKGSKTEAVVPSSLGNAQVVSIGPNAFQGCAALQSVILPDSVERLGESVFSNCASLTSVVLPQGIKSLPENAFAQCTSLRAFTLGENITEIGSCAFDRCTALQSVSLPSGLSSIGDCAFIGCASLKSISLPSSLTRIGSGAFAGSGLESVSLPEKIEKIEYHTFFNCAYLQRVNMSDSVTRIDPEAFKDCVSLSDVSFSPNITLISNHAFEGCISLSFIELPKTLDSVGEGAFLGCDNLRLITSQADSLYVDALNALCRIINYQNLDDGTVLIKKYQGSDAELNVGNLLPGKVISRIGKEAFKFSYSLVSVTVPDTVTDIENGAFSCCYQLESARLPVHLHTIQMNLFRDCHNLKEISIPPQVTSIGGRAFSGCSSLSSIEIPDSVTVITDSAFSGCSSLSSIEIPDSVTAIAAGVFDGCSALKTIKLSNALVTLGCRAFHQCSALQSLRLPSTLVEIDHQAFLDCGSLTDLTIPDSVTDIHDFAFSGCDKLTLSVGRGSYAERYCKSNRLNYQYTNSAASAEENDQPLSGGSLDGKYVYAGDSFASIAAFYFQPDKSLAIELQNVYMDGRDFASLLYYGTYEVTDDTLAIYVHDPASDMDMSIDFSFRKSGGSIFLGYLSARSSGAINETEYKKDASASIGKSAGNIGLKAENCAVGSTVTFGHYEQDGNLGNGEEPIEWLVLANDEDTAVLISKYVLDFEQYNLDQGDATWETCSLRKWLNNTFAQTAFGYDEYAALCVVTVTADGNPSYPTDPGNDTQDRVFLLSAEEVNQYLGGSAVARATRYARTLEATQDGICWWWLRSPGSKSNTAACIGLAGTVFKVGSETRVSHGIRPVVVIKLSE